MTTEEFAKLTKEYEEAFHRYNDYLEAFLTTYCDGKLTHKATKSYTPEEIKKIEKLKNRYSDLEKRCWAILKANSR